MGESTTWPPAPSPRSPRAEVSWSAARGRTDPLLGYRGRGRPDRGPIPCASADARRAARRGPRPADPRPGQLLWRADGPDRGRTSTIGAERAMNPFGGPSRTKRPSEPPCSSRTSPVPVVLRGTAPANAPGRPCSAGRRMCRASIRQGSRPAIAAGARLIDGRPRDDVARGHIPGALAIELSDTFAWYVGSAPPHRHSPRAGPARAPRGEHGGGCRAAAAHRLRPRRGGARGRDDGLVGAGPEGATLPRPSPRAEP